MRRSAALFLGIIAATIAGLYGPDQVAPADSPAPPLEGTLSADPQGWAFHFDVALVDVDGVPHVAWSEAAPGSGRPLVHVAKWTGTDWTRIGRSLNVSRDGFANFLALAGAGNVLHLAWQERSATGNTRIYAKSWDGSNWAATPASLNVDADRGEAGRPALASDGPRVHRARLFVSPRALALCSERASVAFESVSSIMLSLPRGGDVRPQKRKTPSGADEAISNC